MHDWLTGAATAIPFGPVAPVVAGAAPSRSPGTVLLLTAGLFAAALGVLIVAGILMAAGTGWAARKAVRQ